MKEVNKKFQVTNQYLKTKILKDSTSLLLGRLVQMFLQLINGLIIPKLISPIQFGLWRSIFMIYQYATFSNLGTYAAIGVEMPYLKGKGDLEKRRKINSNTFYFNIFISIFLGILLIVSSFFTYGKYSLFYKYGFILFSILIIATNVSDYYLQLLRIEKEFKTISILTIIQVATNLLLSTLLLFYFKKVLLLSVAIIISNLLLIFFAIKKIGIPDFIAIELNEILRLIKFGFPLLFNGILLEIFRSVDQLLIVLFLKPESIGYYALAIAIQRIGFLIPGILSSTTMPHIYEEYGKSNDIKNISSLFEKSLIFVSIICTITMLSMLIFVPVLIRHYLSTYINSLPILYILIAGMYSFGLLGLPEILISITGKINKLIKIQLFNTFLLSLSIFITLSLNYNIIIVSYITVLFYFIYTIMLLFLTFNIYIKSRRILIIKIVEIYAPYFYILATFYYINTFFKIESNLLMDILFALLKFLLLIIFYLPVLFLLERKYSLFKSIRHTFLTR